MATFSALQSRVETEMIDIPSSLTSAGLVPVWINAVILWLQSKHNFQIMQAEQPYITPAYSTTTPTHILGQIPTNYKAKRNFPYYVMFIGTPYRMGWLTDRPSAYRKWETQDINQIGQPRDLMIGEPNNPSFPDPLNPDLNMVALNIEFWPYSDGSSDWSDGNYRVRLPYYGYLPQLVNGTDQNWFTQDGPRAEFVVRASVAMGFLFVEDESRAAIHYKTAYGNYDGSRDVTLGGLARTVIDLDKGVMVQPSRTLRMRRDVYGSPDQMSE